MRQLLTRGFVAVAALALATVVSEPARAQGQGPNTGRFQFLPSVSFMVSAANNPLVLPGSSVGANSLAIQGDLPFQFRGQRWSGRLSLQPGYQKYREDSTLDSLQNAVTLAVDGQLSQRTSLQIDADVVRGDDLRSQLGSDVILPRSLQVRATGAVTLVHQLSRRGSISIDAEYYRLRYPDAGLVGNDGLSAGLSYGHAVSARFGLLGSAHVQSVSFESGSRARSISTTAGIAYQLAPRTRLSIEGGVLFAEQDEAEVLAASSRDSRPGFAFRAGLAHSGQFTSFGLDAWRDMGFTNGLGTATIRNRISASFGYGRARWTLIGTAGVSRNESLPDASPEALRRSVDTWTGCVGAGIRVARNISAVGSFLFAHQIGAGTGELLDIDSYRGAIGIMFQAAPKGDAWKRGNSFDSYSTIRGANATC